MLSTLLARRWAHHETKSIVLELSSLSLKELYDNGKNLNSHKTMIEQAGAVRIDDNKLWVQWKPTKNEWCQKWGILIIYVRTHICLTLLHCTGSSDPWNDMLTCSTLKLWAGKVSENSKLKVLSCQVLEDTSVERNTENGGLTCDISEGNLRFSQRLYQGYLCDILN